MPHCAVSNLSDALNQCPPLSVKDQASHKYELHTKLRFRIRLLIIVLFKVLGHAVAQLVQALRYKP